MANEPVVIVTLLGNAGDPVEYTVAVGTAIPKGTIMYIESDPQTAKASSGDGQAFAGITQAEKTTTDLVTKMSLLTNVVGLAYSASGCTIAQSVKIAGLNDVTTQDEVSCIKLAENAGTALDTIGAGETGVIKFHAL